MEPRLAIVLRRYPRERVVLALVALCTLPHLYPLNTQDVTRLALTTSIVQRHTLNVDPFHDLMLDRAFRDGHWYSDKPPGMSLLAIPSDQLLRGVDAVRGGPALPVWLREGQLWLIRVLTGGIALLGATFLVGRAAEGLARGAGAATAVTFALGTIAGPLGPTLTAHDAAGALGFAALLLATRRRALVFCAGLFAGTAVLFEYQAALILLVVACTVLAARGPRCLLAYLAGVLPPAAALGVYNRIAFGSPFHFSYRYVANRFTEIQHGGFFGIGRPTGHSLWLAFLDGRGLLVVSPVAAIGVVGLVMLYRRGLRATALAALAVFVLYVVVDAGYFDPYGGDAPGPRFLVPALPFVALGLAEAFRRLPLVTGVVAAASIAVVTWDAFTWDGLGVMHPNLFAETIWSRAGAPNALGIALAAAAAAAATAVAARDLLRPAR